jgi:hypothetical protein
MEENMLKTAIELQNVIEKKFKGQPVGICYLIGHCLSEIFKKQGYESRKITGTQALLLKNSKNRYIKYGSSELKGILIGNYHTWCEVDFGADTYIVDPSLKYNLKYLRSFLKIKTHCSIKDILITKTPNSYYFKYKEDTSLELQSLSFLKKISKEDIEFIIQKTLEKKIFF